nr:phage integrase SAM-like domain-containing protein [Flavivirga rizhaonensis]
MNFRFITDFEHYLRTYKNYKNELLLSNNGVMKHLERFKKMVNLAIKLEWMNKSPFSQFQLKYNKYDRQFLNERELQLIEATEFTSSDRLQKIKNCLWCHEGESPVSSKKAII